MTYVTNGLCMNDKHDKCPGYSRIGFFWTYKIGCYCSCHAVPEDRTPVYDVKHYPAGRKHNHDMSFGCCWIDDGTKDYGCTELGTWEFRTTYGNTGRAKLATYCDIHIDEAMHREQMDA